MSRPFASTLLATGIWLSILSLPCRATQAPRELKGSAVGGSVDRFIYDGEGTTAVSFRFSELRPRAFGSEVALSLFPNAFESGTLLLAPDLGFAYNASTGNMTLLAKAGLSTVLALGGAGADFYPGLHLGAGMVIRAGERVGMRIDAVRHTYLAGEGSEALWSIGLGITSLPRRTVAAPPTSVEESGGR